MRSGRKNKGGSAHSNSSSTAATANNQQTRRPSTGSNPSATGSSNAPTLPVQASLTTATATTISSSSSQHQHQVSFSLPGPDDITTVAPAATPSTNNVETLPEDYAAHLQGTALHTDGIDLLSLLLVIIASILCSFLCGIVARNCISIHYHSFESATASALLQQRLGAVKSGRSRHLHPPRKGYSTNLDDLDDDDDLLTARKTTMLVVMMMLDAAMGRQSGRVTRIDPNIAAINRLQYRTDPYAIYTSPITGRQSVLMVVEESVTPGSVSDPNMHRRPFVLREKPGVPAATPTPPQAAFRPPSAAGAVEPPRMDFQQWTRFHPKLCPDGTSVGFDTWASLKSAIQEANAFSAERFVRWSEYFALSETSSSLGSAGIFEDSSFYYEKNIVFRICPGITLKARKGPIFINAENIVIECNGCSLEVGGSHLSFGPHARNVLVRGIDFRKAVSSSLIFYHDGAEAVFQDCRWSDNSAIHSKVGNVADVNSTSIVHFYRCSVGKRADDPAGFVSALSIRAS